MFYYQKTVLKQTNYLLEDSSDAFDSKVDFFSGETFNP